MSAARILVIEDNPSDVSLLRLALMDQGEDFELEVCVDGQQAIDFIDNQRDTDARNAPCVILLDLNLPKHNGLEVLRAIREQPALRNIGVVVLTGSAQPPQALELETLGAHYRRKPSDLSELTELAAEVMAICKGIQTNAVGSTA